jgi:hypothetical protein
VVIDGTQLDRHHEGDVVRLEADHKVHTLVLEDSASRDEVSILEHLGDGTDADEHTRTEHEVRVRDFADDVDGTRFAVNVAVDSNRLPLLVEGFAVGQDDFELSVFRVARDFREGIEEILFVDRVVNADRVDGGNGGQRLL